jgi:hypothetical protein
MGEQETSMPHKCHRCADLENALYQALQERDEARDRAAKATELMMKGEALRDKMMLGSILGGAFETEEKKARMVYILTGKKL